MHETYVIENAGERMVDGRQGYWGWAPALERWVAMAFPFDRGGVDGNTPAPDMMPAQIEVRLNFPEAETAVLAIIGFHRRQHQWVSFSPQEVGAHVHWLRWLVAMGWLIEHHRERFAVTEGFSTIAMVDAYFTRLCVE